MDALNFFLSLPPDMKQAIKEIIDKYGSNYLKSLNPTPRSKIKAVKAMYKLMDSCIQEFMETNTTTCKKGCAYCCYVYIETTIDEALLIRNYCKHNHIPLEEETLKEQSKSTHKNWNYKCIFLDKNNCCSIYPVRPMTCRKYYVNTDPELCNISTGIHKIAILHNLDVELMTSGIFQVRDTGSLPEQLLKVLKQS